MEKKIIVIGAGIAGLATGCYARMNGYGAEIFELHDKPGGLCTSWKRKGYMVDGCLHWLVGSSEKGAAGLHQCWKELGVLNREWVDHDIYMTVEGKDGKKFHMFTNVDKLEKHMQELAPGDVDVIDRFIGLVRKLSRIDMPVTKPKELRTLGYKIGNLPKLLPFIGPFMKYGKTSVQEFARNFRDPFMKKAFAAPWDLPDFPLLAVAFAMAWMNNRSAGYPVGGSLELARDMEKRFTDLGGKMHYKARVQKVLVEGGRAKGIRLTDGTEHKADIVISAADGHATIFDMLEGKFVNDEIRGYYDKLPRFRPLIQASFGINRDLAEAPGFIGYELGEPAEVGGEKLEWLAMHNYSYDHTSAPEGKSVIVFRWMTDYDFWKKLESDREAYDAQKDKVAEFLMGFMESKFPGISEQVEMVDIATPTTFERYTANWEGSMEGWLMTTKSMTMTMSRTLPGLEDFYMVGQWVMPGGGLPSCAITARETMQVVCAGDDKEFVTSTA